MRTIDEKTIIGLEFKKKLKLYSMFWLFLIIVFSVVIYLQNGRKAKLSEEINTLNQLLAESAAEEQTLLQKIEFNKSDEFIEKQAQDEFGLVHSNEVIIYNDNYKPDK